MNRAKNLERLRTESFDICIIGGGASGAGCALDAALRGFKVALIEKNDFASETSSRSTKLIHGGVRYLEQAFKNLDFAQLKQVKHGLEERHIVLNNAPHLAHPLALITPVFSWFEGMYFSIGLTLYGWFAKNDSLPKAQWLTKKETFDRIPTLTPRLHSSVMYYDGQLDDARYCLALVQAAAEAGAVVVNHTAITQFEKEKDGKISGATYHDLIGDATAHIKASLFLNCTGPYADAIRLLANPKQSPRLRPSKGVHIMLPADVLKSSDAMLIPKTKDGRVIFVIPFEGEVMVGTTDDAYQDLDKEPVLESKEVDFLLETLEPYLAKTPNRSQVKSGFGGLRPLIGASESKATKKLVRDHEVEHDETANLLSLLGGKWTTYRLMAKDAVDKAAELLGNSANCSTAAHGLPGSEQYKSDAWVALQKNYGLDPDICQNLVKKYGSRAELVLQGTNAAQLMRILPDYPFIKAEVGYAATYEMACTLRDFFARRTRLEFMDWQAASEAAPVVADLLGEVLGWSVAEQQAAVSAYQQQLEGFMQSAQVAVMA